MSDQDLTAGLQQIVQGRLVGPDAAVILQATLVHLHDQRARMEKLTRLERAAEDALLFGVGVKRADWELARRPMLAGFRTPVLQENQLPHQSFESDPR